MAVKISISKKLEAEIRGLVASPGDGMLELRALEKIVGLLDAANSSQASASGLSAAKFITALQQHRPVVLPPDGPIAGRTYSRLTKCLRDNGVTEEQAAALGVWLAGPGMRAVPGEVTIDRITKNLGDWVTRAVANKPEYQRPEW